MRFETQFWTYLNLDFFSSLFMILQQAELNIIFHLAIFQSLSYIYLFLKAPECIVLCVCTCAKQYTFF